MKINGYNSGDYCNIGNHELVSRYSKPLAAGISDLFEDEILAFDAIPKVAFMPLAKLYTLSQLWAIPVHVTDAEAEVMTLEFWRD